MPTASLSPSGRTSLGVAAAVVVAVVAGGVVVLRHAAPPRAWSASLGGKVFTAPGFDANTFACCTENNELVLARLDSGETVWTRTDLKAYGTPLVDDQRVVVATFGHTVVALDAGSGDELWRHDAGSFVSALAADDGAVIVGRGYGFCVLDAESGDVISDYAARDDSDDREVTEALTIWGGIAYVAFSVRKDFEISFGNRAVVDGGVYAVELGTSTRLWTCADGDRVRHAPLVTEDCVIVATTSGLVNKVYAYERRDGSVRWKHLGVDGVPAVGEGTVSFKGTDSRTTKRGPLPLLEERYFYTGIALADGAERWKDAASTELRAAGVSGPLALYANGTRIESYSAESGRSRWRIGLEAEPAARPVLAGEYLLVFTADAQAQAFRLAAR